MFFDTQHNNTFTWNGRHVLSGAALGVIAGAVTEALLSI